MMEEKLKDTEIYTNHALELVEEWLHFRLNDDFSQFKKNMSTDLILYVHDRIELPTSDEIEKLNSLFDTYVRICARLGLRPTLYQFGLLTGIDNTTFTDWLRGDYRTKQPEYGLSVKRWKSICEGILAQALTDSDGSSANMIFALKSNYHWTELAPIQLPTQETTKLTLEELKKNNLFLEDLNNDK